MNQGIRAFNSTMIDALVKNKRYLIRRPSYYKTFAKIASGIQKQTKKRKHLAEHENIIVPPVLIMSVTNDCNLACAGCYACNQNRDKSREMTLPDIDRVLGEAVDLGVAVVLIAGGEPLLKEGITELPKEHPHTLFVMFTNGLLLDQSKIVEMPKNVVPIVSIEGNKTATDTRRGKGMYAAVMATMDLLNKNDRLFGASITLTQQNYDEVMHTDYLNMLEKKGCGAVFLIEYVPGPDDFDLCLTEVQKQDLCDILPALEKRHDMMIVPLPGDEERYDGCLASGRGFLHISSTGALEACPFAPYSDTNVMNMPLKKALQSDLLRKIRENHHLLSESRGGCALNENSDWIKTLM